MLGVPGNVLIVLVYRRKKEPAKLMIAALAVVDCFTCTVLVPSYPFIVINIAHPTYTYVCFGLTMFVVTMSIWILNTIAFDHHRAICRPLTPHWKPETTAAIFVSGFLWSVVIGTIAWLNVNPIHLRIVTATYIGVSLVIMAILYGKIVLFLTCRVKVGPMIHLETTTTTTMIGGLFRRRKHGPAMHSHVTNEQSSRGTTAGSSSATDQTVSDQSHPAVAITTLPTSSPPDVAVAVHTTSSAAQSTHGTLQMRSNRSMRGVTKSARMLAVVTAVFSLCYVPIYVLEDILGQGVTKLIVFTFYNHAANALIYSFMNKNFRKDAKKLFLKARKHVDFI